MLRTLGPKPGCPEVCELLPEIHGDRRWRRGEMPQATGIDRLDPEVSDL